MILAATGHRPDKLGGYSKMTFNILVTIAKKALTELKPHHVIVGMALGWDQAVAIAAHQLSIEYTAAVPFKGQESKWPDEAQAQYQTILNRAFHVMIVSPGGYSWEKMHIRNEWMVDNCDKVLSMWDGSDGGTAGCVKYAGHMQKEVINLYKQFQSYR